MTAPLVTAPLVTANGAEIPALGFGTFRMNGPDTVRMVRHVLSLGYRHIDTAQIYGNEAEVGEGLAASGVARDDVFLTTKVWVANYRREAFLRSVDDSLRKLGTGHVDLLLLHWPNQDVPLAEQIGALNEVRAAGKVRHIGISNFSTALMAEAASLSAAPLVTNQVEYHPYLGQSAVLAAARAAGMSVTAYYGMADGKVIGDPVIQAIADRHGRTEAQVVLRWLVQQPGVVALSKTVSEARAAANLAIFDFALSAEEMAAIHALARPDGRLVSPEGLAPAWDAA
ncbi:aldo/keto reductase [Inquilinus sp. Marseille-Q2685]|uniref:aldo/keto reductase n=1 Tax=Inquilinus sp. Marseille-Q2685 TaxID=2866581 RepID=UPI001CE4B1C0|nr:aldo/keto reductase [Inquilinus sp. Marseille-Q2685]